MLDNFAVAVVVVVRTRPRAIPLAMITMRKSIHGFLALSYMGMGLRLAAIRAAGVSLKMYCIYLVVSFDVRVGDFPIFHSEGFFLAT